MTREREHGVREANLGRVLRLVHGDGPLSRAAITAHTGLNRSTIGDLVGALADAGLVREQQPGPAGRVGRPSNLVAAAPEVVAIAANPEVDALTIAAVGLDRGIRARVRHDSDGLITPAQTASAIAAQLARWRRGPLRGARPVAVGVAVPGPVRAGDGLVRTAPHLGWRDAPLRDMVEDATRLRTVIGNDANLGAIAEHAFGAARGIGDVVYLNGGASGIGGAIVLDGRLVTGAGGYTGEFGHSRSAVGRDDDRRSTRGALEDEVSRARLLEAVGLRVADDAQLAAAISGDRSPGGRAAAEVARQRRILATALAGAVNALNPAVVVLGGFLAILGDADLPGLLADVRAQTMDVSGEHLDIRPATLADDRLLIGAAEAAFADLLRAPLG